MEKDKLGAIVSKIRELMRSEDPAQRSKAVLACSKVPASESIPLLLVLLKNEADQDVARNMIRVLALFGPDKVSQIAMDLSRNSSEMIRVNAAFGLGFVEAAQSVEALQRFSADPSPEVSAEAVTALKRLASRGVAEALNALPSDPSASAGAARRGDLDRGWAEKLSKGSMDDKFEAIGMIQSHRPAWGQKAMVAALSNETDDRLTASLIMALGHVGDRAAIPALRGFLDSANTRIRANTVEALGLCGGTEALPLASMMLQDPNNRVRANAIVSLKDYPHIDLSKPIREMITSSEKLMQLSALYAIEMLGGDHLVKLIENEALVGNETVFVKAMGILEKLVGSGGRTGELAEAISQRLKKFQSQFQKRIQAAPVKSGETEEGLAQASALPAEEAIQMIGSLIEDYKALNESERKKFIFSLRNELNEVNFNVLTFISTIPDAGVESLVHLALRPYENMNMKLHLDRLSSAAAAQAATATGKEDALFGFENIQFKHSKPLLLLNKELTDREKNYRSRLGWGGKLLTGADILNALREDTQDMIMKATPVGMRIEKAFLCFYQEKYRQLVEGKKSLDSTKLIMSQKKSKGQYDNFSPLGELLWALDEPRYLLCIVTTGNIILFLRSNLNESKAVVKSVLYDFIDGVQLRPRGSVTDVTMKVGSKNLVIPDLFSPQARELEDLITVTLS